ncbi:glycosyltransferase [Methylobacterium sp. J-059]|uniref:glycosyltransferase family protein n=1 Tax=Methylobacterium sp. J-059 TaxID=2836643 RepID=UPI001FBB184C|nr:glycosyltransferase [Methylobacterium sp. J-059]MCJ2042701.1 glycosyltransferase [Methylobacterium sp. J-059]
MPLLLNIRRAILATLRQITDNSPFCLVFDKRHSSSREAIAALSNIYLPSSPPITVKDVLHVFDARWYEAQYPDVKRACEDPLSHYLSHGHRENRDPSPAFSTRWYAAHNQGIGQLEGNGLIHYIACRFREKRPRVALFAYSWTPGKDLDPYIKRIASTVASFGMNVDVYLGSDFAHHDGIKGLRDPADEEHLADWLSHRPYDFAISFNNSLLLPLVVKALRCRVVSVIVDSKGHIFDHSNDDNRATYTLDAIFAPIYRSLEEELRRTYPAKAKNFDFIPAATDVVKRWNARPIKEPAAITWIASLVGDDRLDNLLNRIGGSQEWKEALHVCLEQIERRGYLRGEQTTREALDILIAASHWSDAQIEQQLQNIVTNHRRVEIINRLAPLGLRLYGNDRWKKLMPYNAAVVASFHSAKSLASHADLMEIYNNSLISINLPQAQAGTGIQYRVLDVLASRSLLLTKAVAGTDLSYLFGNENPIETFSTLEELVSKCRYYLEHEAERTARVAECNALVSRGYSFEERVSEYLTRSNAQAAATCLDQRRSPASPGSIALVSAKFICAGMRREGGRSA